MQRSHPPWKLGRQRGWTESSQNIPPASLPRRQARLQQNLEPGGTLCSAPSFPERGWGRLPTPSDALSTALSPPWVTLHPTLPDSARAEAAKRTSASFLLLLLLPPAPSPRHMIYYRHVGCLHWRRSADRSLLNLEPSEPAACAQSQGP